VVFAKGRGEREAHTVSCTPRYFSEEESTLRDRVMLESLLPVRECPRGICAYFRFIGSPNWLKILIEFEIATLFSSGSK